MTTQLTGVIAAGRVLGPYRLGRRIGQGGMASVFAAEHRSQLGLARLVALKVMNLALGGDPTSRASFLREAGLSTRLEHPGIVRTYDVGEQDGLLYMAMELVHGASLSALSGPIDPTLALHVAASVADALHYVHELRGRGDQTLGVVHQDVSPQNIMVGYDGRVRLLDFGVARLADVDGSRTDTVRGKPAYLAPEQLQGGRLDRRVDVFALGVVLFELLAGERLFRRATVAATYGAILSDVVPDVRDLRPEVPKAVAAVVARALRRDPGERWPSAAAMAEGTRAAHGAAGLAAVSDAAMSEWVMRVAPAQFSMLDLEADLTKAASTTATGVCIHDQPTLETNVPALAVPDLADAREHSPSQRRSTRVGKVAAAVVFAGSLVLVAWAAGRHEPWHAPTALPGSIAPSATAMAPAVITPWPVKTATDDVPVPSGVPARRTIDAIRVRESPSLLGRPRVSDSAPRSDARARSAVMPPLEATAPPSVSSLAASVAPGWLSVRSTVWGRVELDGRPVGDSPILRLPLPTGTHVLRIVTSRGEQTRSVVVGPANESKEQFTF